MAKIQIKLEKFTPFGDVFSQNSYFLASSFPRLLTLSCAMRAASVLAGLPVSVVGIAGTVKKCLGIWKRERCRAQSDWMG